MTIDIKAIRVAAESTPNPWPMSLQPNTVIALCDEVERLRKGAARYQWLRDHCARMTVASMSFVECPQSWYSDHDVESNDAAIDEEMEAESERHRNEADGAC